LPLAAANGAPPSGKLVNTVPPAPVLYVSRWGINKGALQTIPLGSGTSYVSALLVSSDRFVLVGISPMMGASILRLNSDGSLDSLCGSHGLATAPISVTGFVAAALDAEGSLLLAGQGKSGSSAGMWFARLWM